MRAARVLATAGEVAALYGEHRRAVGVPGLAYGVVLDGRLLYSGGFGLADLARGVPADARTVFRVASISKSVTALAVLQLRDAGRLELDAPVARYLSELEEQPLPSADAPAPTLRHLLTHTAGLPEDNAWGDRQLACSDTGFSALLRAGISFSSVPGTRFEYSNLGYALLGQVVQRVSGLPFADYTRRFILEPLGMRDSVWDYREADPARLASGYLPHVEGHEIAALEPHGAFGAMGGLLSSVEDFARYATLHLDAWPPRDAPESGILKRSSLREMHQPWCFNELRMDAERPFAQAYGYGLTWSKEDDLPACLSHNGGLPGFGGNWLFVPALGLALICFTNQSYAVSLDLNRYVLRHIVENAGLSAAPEAPSAVLLDRRERLQALLLRWDDAQAQALFADNFFRDRPWQAWRTELDELLACVGPVLASGPLLAENRLRGRFTLSGAVQDLEVFFSLTPEPSPRVQAVDWRLLERR